MVYRQLKRRETAVIEQSESQLSEEQVAALIRQSSTRQVLENVESADIQLTGAQKFAVSQGLNAGKIMIMHEGDGKRGVSGTLRIDQREKLQEIVSGIKDDKIKLVWAYSVSRLFRDRYGVQVATFIELCAQHKVRVVIANAKTFDFSNSFDVTLFQMLANVAARENEDRSNLLHTAKSNKAQRGEYDGRPIKPGFIVDRDKDSPTFDHYIEYAPMAEIVRRLYARFRELGGQFNALWYEVSQMPVVFPPFDASVDSKDIRKFLLIKVCSVHGPSSQRRYKDAQGKWHVEHTGCELKGHECKLAGYHLSKVGLFHLLTAVEYAGYWHADGEVLMNEDGTPKRNHDRVVPLDTWQFAYSALSFHTIDGEDNQERADVRSTWVPAKKQDGRYILHGILTSPLGTVNLTGGEYRVAERRNENTSDRSNTLTINAKLIEYIFRQRLLERIADTNYERMLADALTSLRANNARALISVDEQISRYKNEIASIDAFVLAMGAKIDASTLQDYGKMRSEAVKELVDLEKKKHAADVEEKSLQELYYTLGSFRYGSFDSNEDLRRFIRLVTESISITEYSSRFISLTIKWASPFAQTDVAYLYRAKGGKQQWTESEEFDLAMLYPLVDRAAILEHFPTRTWVSISSWAQGLGISRYTLSNSGPSDRFGCYLDQQLLERHGWKPGERVYWSLAVCGDLETECQ